MSAAALTVDQGAALLWLRKVGGHAGTDARGYVVADRSVCPVLLAAFNGLARRQLVDLQSFPDGAYGRSEVSLTEAGASFPIEPESERRLDALLRRFDD
ncbi:hypothetical protein [Pleomorphomonas koreensis]|uniref:hypothetical protein n=1 Tax=Pleomorphomonas koreensis TaxID=257440 RepID=UPI000424D0DA|nr:hypothetical protein [Pleomorphomonas koreensis]